MRKIFSLLTAILFAGSMMATDVAVTIHASSGDYYAKTHSWVTGSNSGPAYDQVVLDEVITANLIGTGNNGKYYTDWRFYTNGSNNGSFSIDAAEGYELQSVTFTYSVSNSGALYLGETKLTSKTAVEVSGQKAVFQCKNTNTATNGQVKLTAIAVTYQATSGGGGEEETHTYTVAGEPTTFFGSSWDPADTNNDMVKQQDGTYKWEKTEVTLPISTIAFKVVKDHEWGENGVNAYPAQNYILNIAEAGVYTITITFDPANDNAVNAVAQKTGSADVDDTAVLGIGAWDNEQDWSQADMVLSGDKSYATITKTLTAGDYRFKTIINGGWRSNAYVYHRDFRAAAGISENEDPNMKLQADVDGDYIFNWFFANDSLEIIFPEVDPEPQPQPSEAQVIYKWSNVEAENVGTTILGASGVTIENVKIHTNTDNVPGIKFASSYVYADGKWIAIKPANGGFQAGDKVNIAVCFNNSDDTKQAQIKAFAANGSTELFLTEQGINGRTQAGDPAVQTFTLAADQDSILLGRYGSTGTFITTLNVTREAAPQPPVENHTYTVAGEPETFFGSNWDPTDENNDMVKQQDGTYKWEKTDVTLAIGTIAFKVVKDHDWNDGLNAYPAQNYILNIAEDGVYTITITFDPANDNAVNAVAQKTGEAEIEHVYTVVGVEALIGYNWGDGLNAPENEMTKTADDLYTLVKENITLAASSYEYQVADNHDWRNVPNSVLEISQSGIYNVTFTFVPSTGATNAVADLQEAIDVDPTAELGIGAWDNQDDWSQADMVLSGDKSYATITKTLTAGDYRFKTIINGGWRSNAYVYHRDFRAAAGISENEDPNMKLQADVDGDYIFNWFFANDSLEIIFPAAVAPTAAPAEPTPERYQAKAVYAAKYEADCNFGEWGSGTQYAQEEYGKKFVTTNLGYFGLEFTGKDCSEMEALHLDVWAASDIAFSVVPIHGGAEVGVTVNIEGQKWNAIDIALSEFAGVTNWSNVYQIKIANAANLTFWLNNVYFYTTQTKTVDLVDGYYLIGTMNDWEIHNITAAHLFAVNPDNDAEYKLTYTLADGDEFKVVAVANNELGAWYPAEGDNYVVDFAHAGERDIYFRPDYQGGADWHAACIYVAPDADASPWETWFATGDTWNPETESYLDWDAENEKATVHINVDKYGQWRAQVKYHGPIAEEGKCYRVALKMKSNNAINNVTVKYQDNVEMVYVNNIALAANTEYVFDQTAAGLPNGNGIMVLDFGFAHAGDIIEIYDVVIEEVECPVLEPTYYLIGSMNDWNPNGEEQYLFTVNPNNEDELMLNCTLTEGAIFKVVETTSNSWFPNEGGEASNYVVDAAHAGDVTIYFRPDYLGGEGWHYGCIYVDVHTGTAISNTAVDAKAEKILRNGMILIVKGDKTYNVMGQIVK